MHCLICGSEEHEQTNCDWSKNRHKILQKENPEHQCCNNQFFQTTRTQCKCTCHHYWDCKCVSHV